VQRLHLVGAQRYSGIRAFSWHLRRTDGRRREGETDALEMPQQGVHIGARRTSSALDGVAPTYWLGEPAALHHVVHYATLIVEL
jgi:hypothetical protein